MKIVLLKDVPKVGKKYEVKNVADGFALNSLIPRKVAIAATEATVKRIEAEKAKGALEEKMREELLEKDLEKLSKITVEVSGKTNEQGHLFASIHAKEVADAIGKTAHVMLDEKYIDLEKPIKETGDHQIAVKVGKKEVSLTLSVKAEA